MKKVLIITPCGLPVPAVKGGAVSTLMESIIKQNEINDQINLTVISSYDKKAADKSSDYTKTKFIYINKNNIINKLDKIISKVITILKDKGKKEKEYNYIWKLYVIKKIRQHIRDNDYDKIVIQNTGYTLNVFNKKNILLKTRGSLYYHLHNDIPSNCNKKIIKECKFILISNYLKQKLHKEYGINENIHILYNGFDCEKFKQELNNEEKEDIRTKLGIGKNDKVVIFTGRIIKNKGIYELTQAFSRIKSENVKLLIVGSSSFGEKSYNSFEKKMKSEFDKLKPNVIFTGYIPYEEIWKYYKIADVAVLPSIWQEPMGLTIVEAMISELPVVSTLSGGIPEFLKEEYGIMLKINEELINNIAESIDEILNNLDEWKLRGKRASQYIENIVNEKRFYNEFCKILDKDSCDYE